jgi:DNA-binding transcriptional LysR family regulator
MNVSFRQMRLFLALAETGSVSGAARVMHVTQPTASMQLREISESVGLPLYELISRRIHLTEAGLELARTARAMVTEWEAFGQKVDNLKGLTRGRLRLAAVSTAQYFIPRLLGSFCRRHPDIDVALQVLNRDGVLGRMRDNRDDLYIMSQPPQDIELEDRVFMSNPLVVIAPPEHRLAGQRQIALRELRSELFILRESGSGTRMAVDQHFRSARFSPSVRLELGSNEAIREAVAAGLGLSVLSSHALGTSGAHARGVATLQVQGFPLPSQWHLVWQKGKRPSPVAQAFSDHLLKPARRTRTSD